LHDVAIKVDSRTLGDMITKSLRQAIIRGELRPGEPLVQETLARAFNVSRIPIRESLRQLATEGLVEHQPHKGAVVARLSLDELDELYGIIWSLEALAIPKAIKHLTEADIDSMREILTRMRAARLTPIEWYRCNVAFHRVILVASQWKRVLRTVDENRTNIGRYVTDPVFFARHVREWTRRNNDLFEACQQRDVQRALAALEVMRTLSTATVREHLKEMVNTAASASDTQAYSVSKRRRRKTT
jgi:DNA-binding GntR family transcriptional regulator